MDFTRPPLCCCCCGGPHLNGNCETYSYCDRCELDLVYCSCEPDMVLIPASFPWMAQPETLEEPDEMVVIDEVYPWMAQPEILEEPDEMVVIDESYPWLADDWLPEEQHLNQSIQPQLEHEDFNGGSQLKENCEPLDCTSGSKQKEQGLIIKESEESKIKREEEDKDEIDRVIDSICALFYKGQLEETWKPHHLYLKFMEFLPNKLKKLDDVLAVSFWPP